MLQKLQQINSSFSHIIATFCLPQKKEGDDSTLYRPYSHLQRILTLVDWQPIEMSEMNIFESNWLHFIEVLFENTF